MSIYEKLLKIQSELKCNKSQWNDFGKYNYRSCEDILTAVKPLLVETKTTLYFSDAIKSEGGRNYIQATLSFIDIESGEKIEATGYAREEETKKGMDGSQITGASSSYARKYALGGIFAIDDIKDSDYTNVEPPKTSPQATKPQSTTSNTPKPANAPKTASNSLKCSDCDAEVTEKVAEYSKKQFGKVLCMKCQKRAKDMTPIDDDSLPF